jgi:Alpha-glutamyl/putrescinyl thymine pyrophosphorylase clade 3
MPMFCRHNRLTVNCPICSRELSPELGGKPPRRSSVPSAPRSRGTPAPRRSGVVTKKLARAADDGYRNPLVPGLRATADAERLAAAMAAAAARLEPPGPYPEVAAEPDLEEATWLAFLLALGSDEGPTWASGESPEGHARTADAYRAWVARAGSQAEAFRGEPGWTPQRRFSRVFERLALPGFARAARFDLLTALGAAGRYELEAGELWLAAGEDSTTDAAKRLLVSGDKLLLERRARELAEAAEVPLGALDRAFAVWGTPGDHADLAAEAPAPILAALSLR